MSPVSYLPYLFFMATKHKEEMAVLLAVHPTTRALGLKYLRIIGGETLRYNARVIQRLTVETFRHMKFQRAALAAAHPASWIATGVGAAAIGYVSTADIHKAVPGVGMGGAGFGPGLDPGLITQAESPREAVLEYWNLPDQSNWSRRFGLIYKVMRG